MTADLQIASASDDRWHALLSGRMQPSYQCLALRILMIRLTHAYQRAGGDTMRVVEELRTFFQNNLRFARNDYRTIFPEFAQ